METKIRLFRQEKGLTQQQLADLVGVTRQTINALENARYNPSLLLAYHITKILGKDAIEDIFIFGNDD
ncbi:helix-turn-helix transcriptional regulator [Methanobrevibacter sp.]|uniref:helix-turn-helix transcriptional regulator n=1 Tax=Methanobrevibacter sp. TaxID=66852 RepID=UPI003866810A